MRCDVEQAIITITVPIIMYIMAFITCTPRKHLEGLEATPCILLLVLVIQTG